jgi:hypothetical protein
MTLVSIDSDDIATSLEPSNSNTYNNDLPAILANKSPFPTISSIASTLNTSLDNPYTIIVAKTSSTHPRR